MEELSLKWKPRVVVIGSGGIKGLMILGCLSPLEDVSLLESIDTFCGVSVGAIICLLMILGYKIREIVGNAAKIDIFKEISDIDIHQIVNHNGILSNEPIRQKLITLVLDKIGTIPTLYDLYMKTGKSLIIVTLNTTDERTEYMNPFTHPNISCIDAIMYSMNIPFIYYQLMDTKGKIYVDGILADPYPVNYFDDHNTDILGIYIKTTNNDIKKDALSYIYKIFHASINQRVLSHINKSSNKCRHIELNTVFTDVIGVSLNIKDKAKLLIDGYNIGKSFIENLTHPITKKEIIKYNYPPYYL